MTPRRNREEVINTQLAVLLSKLGVAADAETIHVHGRHRPDVLFQMRGMRFVIEGKFADQPAAEEQALRDARRRVTSGIAHIAAAVVYPAELRATATARVLGALETASLRYRVVAEAHESESWFAGTPADLMDALRRSWEALIQDDVVERTARSLSERIETVSRLWLGQPGACDRLSRVLGLDAPDAERDGDVDERRAAAARIAALVLANAFIFQEQLALSDTRVDTLQKLAKREDLVKATSEHWRWIQDNINYVPIFRLGERALDELPASPHTVRAVQSLLDEARSICRRQTALRHDLMGRIYHWLLHDAKHLGTYYTSVSAATLLLKLAFALAWERDFAEPRSLAGFKVADLACGTGTLLMAAAQALTDRHIGDRAERDLALGDRDISVLHQTLMQNVMHGYDILPTAVHLTASTLALLAPEVAFRHMNLFIMPVGVDHKVPRLGSLDFLGGREVRTQLALDDTQLETVRTGASGSAYAKAWIPESGLDLCVMNPPFVSSRDSNKLFGSLPEADRKVLQKELKSIAKSLSVSITAGLGAVFAFLARRHVKRGGRIAFVLPVAVATGESWRPVRALIAADFHLEVVVSSHDPERFNFSENTDLSEVMFIARRLQERERPGDTVYVNLRRNPRTIHEALDYASRIAGAMPEAAAAPAGGGAITEGGGTLAEVSVLAHPQGDEKWLGAIFTSAHLLQAYVDLVAANKVACPAPPAAEGSRCAGWTASGRSATTSGTSMTHSRCAGRRTPGLRTSPSGTIAPRP